ncbi:hypothetical protein ACNAW0_27445 [Micromonospora sp. SL1-18]|uniref:hypothetical protein n=1 Tax=Micromonospora sp. SL1-18 TaxID=3399128 RepID=UPI003A4D832B
MSTKPLKRRSLLRTVSAAGVLGLLGALLGVSPAYADPSHADLAVTAAVDPTEVLDVDGWTYVTVDVRNIGSLASQEFTLALSLPAGAYFFSDGFVLPPSWNCDLYGTATCTHAPLAAGAAADPLSIPFGLPDGTAGDTVTVSATATSDREPNTRNNTGQATMTYIPSTADLFFAYNDGPSNQDVIEGDRVEFTRWLVNGGTRRAQDVTITVPVPEGLTNSKMSSPYGWTCAFGDTAADGRPGWRCTHAPLWPGQWSDEFSFSATISGPPGVITLGLNASTTSPESNLDNNTAEHLFTVLQAATIHGTVWMDENSNLVRDATDPGAPVGPFGIDRINVRWQNIGTIKATVNSDGTYIARVRPGTYRVEFYMHRFRFIASPDSDLVSWTYNGTEYYGYTDWVTVAAGDDVTLDAGASRF